MTYEQLTNSVTEIVKNKDIYKSGLTLKYELSDANHKKMDEHLFIKTKSSDVFEHRDIIEIEIGGINVILTKEKIK